MLSTLLLLLLFFFFYFSAMTNSSFETEALQPSFALHFALESESMAATSSPSVNQLCIITVSSRLVDIAGFTQDCGTFSAIRNIITLFSRPLYIDQVVIAGFSQDSAIFLHALWRRTIVLDQTTITAGFSQVTFLYCFSQAHFPGPLSRR